MTWPLYSPDTSWQSLVIRAESEEGGMEESNNISQKNTAYDTFENFNYQVVEDLFGDRCEFWKNIYEQFYQVNIFSGQAVPTKNNTLNY